MKIKMIILLTVGVVVVGAFLSACSLPISWEYPDYKFLGDSKEMGRMFELGGNIYHDSPVTRWRPLPGTNATYIGTVDKNNLYDIESDLYNYEDGDINKTFIWVYIHKEYWYSDVEFSPVYYYRADVTLPPFDRSGIDEVGYLKNTDHVKPEDIKPIMQDSETIDKLFQVIGTTSESQGYSSGDGRYFCSIVCMNSNFPGIGIAIPVYATHQDYWMEVYPPNWGVFEERTPGIYAKIPQELLEAIAGEKLPFPAEYIADKQATASQ